jgi:hypothetical protein
MPLDLANVDAVNAVWFVPADSPWRDGLRTLMVEMGGDGAAIEAWLDLLQRRAAGEHRWDAELDGGVLPDGRPMPAARRYNDGLSGATTGDLLVLRPAPLALVVDVWGPGEVGGEPGTLGLELLVRRSVVHPWFGGAKLPDGTIVNLQDPAHYARLARYGEAFAAWMARGCELLTPVFALSDGMQPVRDFLGRARPGRVRHPAPAHARIADYAWALAYWAPERVDDDLARRLRALALPAKRPMWPDGLELSVRTLATDGTFLRSRTILGSETRASRANWETPLAAQLRLRSNHLLYRT